MALDGILLNLNDDPDRCCDRGTQGDSNPLSAVQHSRESVPACMVGDELTAHQSTYSFRHARLDMHTAHICFEAASCSRTASRAAQILRLPMRSDAQRRHNVGQNIH